MQTTSIVLVIVVCTALTIRTKTLLIAALWLAVTSAALAALLYSLGAREIAVIELSVGAGLVPVLFVFGVSLLGKTSNVPPPLVPHAIAFGLVGACLALLTLFILPVDFAPAAPATAAFDAVLWGKRPLDLLTHGVLIFASVISILNLLNTARQVKPEAR